MTNMEMTGRKGGEDKRSRGGGPNSNIPRWASWRWGENGENVCLEGGVGVEDKQLNTTNVPIWVR